MLDDCARFSHQATCRATELEDILHFEKPPAWAFKNPGRKKYKLLFHSGSFKKKVLKYGTPKPSRFDPDEVQVGSHMAALEGARHAHARLCAPRSWLTQRWPSLRTPCCRELSFRSTPLRQQVDPRAEALVKHLRRNPRCGRKQ